MGKGKKHLATAISSSAPRLSPCNSLLMEIIAQQLDKKFVAEC
jgi:hypothetical protein